MNSKARHERESVKAHRPDRLIASAQRNITLIRENVPVLALTGVAFGASYGHIAKLCGDFGPHGWVQFATAGCVDLLCIIGAEERQRDKRIGRARQWGFVSWPTIVLIAGILVTLAANVATADKHFFGYCVAAWPAGALLLAVSVLERRATFEAPASTRVRRRERPPGTGTAVRPESAPVLPGTPPVPAASTVPVPAEAVTEEEPAQPWTDEDLIAEARYQWLKHAATGVRLSQGRFEMALKQSPRGGAGRSRVIEALKVVRAEMDAASPEAEAVGQ